MCAQKKLSARDISEKFGVKITEKDLEPEVDKDNHFAKQFASLESLLELENKNNSSKDKKHLTEKPDIKPENVSVKKSTEKVFVEECSDSFKDLYEKSIYAGDVPEKAEDSPRGGEKIKNRISLSRQTPGEEEMSPDDDDFSKYFDLDSAKVADKDSVRLSDEEAKPFEISEEIVA